jgi:hypothetical protein
MSDYIVHYKSIKNGYARINKDGILELSVPKLWKLKPELILHLVAKAKNLELRHAQIKTPAQATEEGTMLFGEWVSWDQLGCEAETSLPQLASELYEYSKPILDDYAARIGKSYHSLSIKKSKTKR